MKSRYFFLLGVAFALIGALVAGIGIFSGNFSPRGYVTDKYVRSPAHDIGRDALAYTSSDPPSRVAADITRAWQPLDQYVDASGVYLRYDDDAVVIRPTSAGSLILLERVATAYPRYYRIVGNAWGWGRGTTVRGGGPGFGK